MSWCDCWSGQFVRLLCLIGPSWQTPCCLTLLFALFSVNWSTACPVPHSCPRLTPFLPSLLVASFGKSFLILSLEQGSFPWDVAALGSLRYSSVFLGLRFSEELRLGLALLTLYVQNLAQGQVWLNKIFLNEQRMILKMHPIYIINKVAVCFVCILVFPAYCTAGLAMK